VERSRLASGWTVEPVHGATRCAVLYGEGPQRSCFKMYTPLTILELGGKRTVERIENPHYIRP